MFIISESIVLKGLQAGSSALNQSGQTKRSVA
jgi:hypothetical protein